MDCVEVPLVRRAPAVHIAFERRPVFDTRELLTGQCDVVVRDQAVAVAGDSQREILLTAEDLRVLTEIDDQHCEDSAALAERLDLPEHVISQLVYCGLLHDVSDGAPQDDVHSVWDPTALYFHRKGRWQGRGSQMEAPDTIADAEDWLQDSPARFNELSAQHGAPPSALYNHGASKGIVALPSAQSSPLDRVLEKRRTVRLYDTEKSLSLATVANVLSSVFGVHGYARLSDDLVVLRKNSPSAGSLHPVEVFPLIVAVDGIQSGLYHYRAGEHRLALLESYGEAEAREQVARLSAGQAWFSTAQVTLLYTGRYERNMWKYRNHPRAYRTVHMDAAHLSQNLYLKCAEAGLGAYYTAACNDADIDMLLGLDGVSHGAIAMGGFGLPEEGGEIMGMVPDVFTPGMQLE